MATTENMPHLVLDALKRGEDAALDAVRTFVTTVEETLTPATKDEESKVREITGSVFEMVDRLLTVQFEFMRNLIGISTEAVGEVSKQPTARAAKS